jgi:hypothetical protein
LFEKCRRRIIFINNTHKSAYDEIPEVRHANLRIQMPQVRQCF